MPVDVNEENIRIRVRAPGDFKEGSFRTIRLKRDKPRVNAVAGRLKDQDTLTVQSLLFPRGDGWDKEAAVKWAREHDYAKAKSIGPEPQEEDAVFDAPAIEDALLEGFLAELLNLGARDEASKEDQRRIPSLLPVQVKAIREDKGEADIIISSGDLDRDREVVLPEGMQLPKPKRLPLVAGHVYSDLKKQIGDVGRPRVGGHEITASPRWFVGMGNSEADWAFTLVKLGVAAFSIGFIPWEWEDADLNDEKTFQAVKDGKMPLRTYKKWELVEVSQVIIPSNRAAVQQLEEAGVLEKGATKSLGALLTDEPMLPEAQKGFEQALAAYKNTGEKEDGRIDLLNPKVPPEVPEEEREYPHDIREEGTLEALFPTLVASRQAHWKVGGLRGMRLLDDEVYDAKEAGEAIVRLAGGDPEAAAFDWGLVRRGHVIFDASDTKHLASYRLPFAKVRSGELAASRQGLEAVREALPKAGVGEGAQAAAGRFVDTYLGKAPVRKEEENSAALIRGLKEAMDELRTALLSQITQNHGTLETGLQEAMKGTLEAAEVQAREVVSAAISARPWASDEEHIRTLSAALMKAVADMIKREIAKAQGDVDQYRRNP